MKRMRPGILLLLLMCPALLPWAQQNIPMPAADEQAAEAELQLLEREIIRQLETIEDPQRQRRMEAQFERMQQLDGVNRLHGLQRMRQQIQQQNLPDTSSGQRGGASVAYQYLPSGFGSEDSSTADPAETLSNLQRAERDLEEALLTLSPRRFERDLYGEFETMRDLPIEERIARKSRMMRQTASFLRD